MSFTIPSDGNFDAVFEALIDCNKTLVEVDSINEETARNADLEIEKLQEEIAQLKRNKSERIFTNESRAMDAIFKITQSVVGVNKEAKAVLRQTIQQYCSSNNLAAIFSEPDLLKSLFIVDDAVEVIKGRLLDYFKENRIPVSHFNLSTDDGNYEFRQGQSFYRPCGLHLSLLLPEMSNESLLKVDKLIETITCNANGDEELDLPIVDGVPLLISVTRSYRDRHGEIVIANFYLGSDKKWNGSYHQSSQRGGQGNIPLGFTIDSLSDDSEVRKVISES